MHTIRHIYTHLTLHIYTSHVPYTLCSIYAHTIHLIGKNSNQGNLNRRFNPARSGRITNGVNGTGTGDGSDGGILVMTWEEIRLIDG